MGYEFVSLGGFFVFQQDLQGQHCAGPYAKEKNLYCSPHKALIFRV